MPICTQSIIHHVYLCKNIIRPKWTILFSLSLKILAAVLNTFNNPPNFYIVYLLHSWLHLKVYIFTSIVENSVDPDQMALLEAS